MEHVTLRHQVSITRKGALHHYKRKGTLFYGNIAVVIQAQQAGVLVAEMLVQLPEKPERNAILNVLTHLRGDTEETAHLTDYIREMWETIDLLTREFGEEGAHKIMHAPGCTYSDVPEQ